MLDIILESMLLKNIASDIFIAKMPYDLQFSRWILWSLLKNLSWLHAFGRTLVKQLSQNSVIKFQIAFVEKKVVSSFWN